MADILVRPIELRQVAIQLRTDASKISRALELIDQSILSLKGDKFLGHRADAVQVHYTPKRKALLKAKDIILHFVADLDQTAAKFEQADRQSGAMVGSNGTSNIDSKLTPAPAGRKNKLPSIDQIRLNMGDKRWKNIDMNNKTGEDIGAYGCLLTVLAMICRANGIDMDPSRIDAWNDVHKGYSQNGSYMSISAQERFLTETLGRNIDQSPIYARNSTQDGLPNIRKQLETGVPVVLHIDSKINPKDGHFVLAVGVDSKGNYICADPNGGKRVIISKGEIRDARVYK